MAKQTLNKGSSANDGTGDTLRAGAQKINENFTELYDLLGATSGTFLSGVSFDSDTNGIEFKGSSSGNAHQTFLVPTDPTADRTITLPDLTGTVSLITATETLTNKTLTTPQINDTSSDHQYVVAVSELAADRNVTLPLLAGDDEFTFNAHTQTLTNKTLTTPTITSPAITTPKITTSINDANNAEVIEVPATSSAVNHFKITNSASSSNPVLEATGDDTNVGFSLGAKGTGVITITPPVVVSNSISFASQSLTGAGAISLNTTTVLLNSNSDFTATLADGTVIGQTKILTNKNSGTVTIDITSFQPGNNLVLQQHEGAMIVWDGDEWALISTYGGAVT